MRYLILFILMPFAGMAQTQFWNTSCSTASFLSQSYSGDTTGTLSDSNCVGGQFKLYYYYHAVDNAASLNVMSYTTSANTTFKAYGPFNSLSGGCAATWGLGNQVATGSSSTSQTFSHALVQDKFYILEITVLACATNLTLYLNQTNRFHFSKDWETGECTDCITGFRPKAGKYIVSGWVKQGSAAGTVTSYTEPSIVIQSTSMATVNLYPTGEIIDGWQRIEGEVITITNGDFDILLSCGSSEGGCYFDDIRIHPFDATMVTYVYDPISLRLVAELDERNYAKFYEYDEDGKLIRVKKETEKGIMTIQETRENNSKE